MNYNKKTVQDVDVKGKKVLLRCDFNVPQDKETGAITSDKRIVAALPTIKYLLDNGAAVIACSHLGKPKGEWKMKLTLAPVAERLSQLLGREVIFAKDIVGEDAKAKAAAAPHDGRLAGGALKDGDQNPGLFLLLVSFQGPDIFLSRQLQRLCLLFLRHGGSPPSIRSVI